MMGLCFFSMSFHRKVEETHLTNNMLTISPFPIMILTDVSDQSPPVLIWRSVLVSVWGSVNPYIWMDRAVAAAVWDVQKERVNLRHTPAIRSMPSLRLQLKINRVTGRSHCTHESLRQLQHVSNYLSTIKLRKGHSPDSEEEKLHMCCMQVQL